MPGTTRRRHPPPSRLPLRRLPPPRPLPPPPLPPPRLLPLLRPPPPPPPPRRFRLRRPGPPPRRQRHRGPPPSRPSRRSESVEPRRIGAEDIVDRARCDARLALQQPQRLDLRRIVVVAVVGADQQIP